MHAWLAMVTLAQLNKRPRSLRIQRRQRVPRWPCRRAPPARPAREGLAQDGKHRGGVVASPARGLQARQRGRLQPHTLETAGAFWHLVDLLWLVLFPLVYVMR